MKGSTIQIGRYGEQLAAAHLTQHGFRILAQNLHIGHDELDLIAESDTHLIFVEVKTRSCIDPAIPSRYGRPSRAVTMQKRHHTLGAARAYLREHPSDKIARMDVIEIYLSREDGIAPRLLKLNWIPNAYRGK